VIQDGVNQEAHVRNLIAFLKGSVAVALFGAVSILGPVQSAQAQGAAAQNQKKVKDQGEYDLYNAALKDIQTQNWNKAVTDLDAWKQKYPDSDFKSERLAYYVTAYQGLQQWPKVIATSKQILATDPKDITSLYWLTFLTPMLNDNSAPVLETGEKAANGLLAAERPEKTPEANWATAKKSFDLIGHKTLGWIAMQRKQQDAAEKEFIQCLKMDPNQGEIAYWLGSVIIAQQKPERYSEAMFAFAHAAAFDGPGALPPAGRQQADSYLATVYKKYHGGDPSLDQLKEMAKATPFPPDGFKIKTTDEISAAKDEQFKKEHPHLALWMGIKENLAGADGAQYFESSVKGAAVPQLKGTVVSAKPALNSKELVVALSDATTPEVTLKLDEALAGKPKVGSVIDFEGVPSAFTKDPFMLTFDVEKAKISGLEFEAPPARKAPAKKAAAKKG
jgi:tetratricopeptide (TPR) repeat protein